MSDFSPELYKAASGAKSLPINKDRTDDPSFQSPVFADYLAKGDLSGYMTALWQGAAARDIPSLRILIFLARIRQNKKKRIPFERCALSLFRPMCEHRGRGCLFTHVLADASGLSSAQF